MSGTSLDGVDGVLADFGAHPLTVLAHASAALDPELKAELLALNQPGSNELHRAALAANALMRVYADVVSQLLASQANPNLDANDGSSPLLKAVANGHLQVIQMLLNAGAHRNVTMRDGTTLDDIVAKAKDSRIRAIFG